MNKQKLEVTELKLFLWNDKTQKNKLLKKSISNVAPKKAIFYFTNNIPFGKSVPIMSSFCPGVDPYSISSLCGMLLVASSLAVKVKRHFDYWKY